MSSIIYRTRFIESDLIFYAELFSGKKKTQGEWKEKVVGAGAVTKDFSRKSYFIQIFDVQQRQKVNT